MGSAKQRGRRAQAMVEFALLTPLIFLVLLGLLDFGRAVATYVVIAEAAHDGARQLVLIKNVGQPNTIIGATLSEIGGGGVSLTADPCMAAATTPCPSSPTTPNTGYIWMTQNLTPGNNEVTVTVTYEYAPLTGIITDAIGGGPITLTASSSMRAEY